MMIKRMMAVFPVVFFCAVMFHGSLGFGAQTFEDAIIAVVDEEIITLQNLRDYSKAIYTQLKMDGRHSDSEIQEIMARVEAEGISRLVDDRLVLNAANKRGIEARRLSIDQRVSEIRSRYSSEELFLAALGAEGLTLTDLRQRIADQLKAQFFIDMEIKPSVQVNPKEVTDYYYANTVQFQRPQRADVSSIFIPYGDAPETARQQANTVYGQLKMGQDFSEAAAHYSKAPSLGVITRGEMRPQIENQIFNLKPGEFTWPINSDQGVFIFKLKQIVPAEVIPLEDVKDHIVQALFNQKFREAMEAWLEEARQQAYIEIKNP